MTPLWLKAVSRGLLSPDEHCRLASRAIARTTHCFDFAPVSDLLKSTAEELSHAAPGPFDLGDAVVMPAHSFWVEWGAFGLLMAGLDRPSTSGAFMVWAVRGMQNPLWPVDQVGRRQFLEAGVISLGDDGLFRLGRSEAFEVVDQELRSMTFGLLMHALAAIAILASPSAKRIETPQHRGIRKQIRRTEPKAPEVKASQIVIKIGEVATANAQQFETASPRAYHFCRAHSRMKGGRVEKVRAHWRGDPAFGLRIGRYRVEERGK